MKLGVVMDPIGSINFKKDSTLSILLEAQLRGHELFYMEPTSLFLREKGAYALISSIVVRDDSEDWYDLSGLIEKDLSFLDMILMRQDPPFDSNYFYNTYVLDAAERSGVKVINRSNSLRDCNEKVFISQFPQCCTPFMVSSDESLIKSFINEHLDVVIKPLDGMGGSSIFRIKKAEPNLSVILETMTKRSLRKVMIQKYIPEIIQGDKRILLINGNPLGGAIARVPAEGEFRGNLAAGATPLAKALSDRDKWICEQVGPSLKKLGLVIVGLDVIGDYLTEINVTSPTCFREYKNLLDIDVSSILFDVLEEINST